MPGYTGWYVDNQGNPINPRTPAAKKNAKRASTPWADIPPVYRNFDGEIMWKAGFKASWKHMGATALRYSTANFAEGIQELAQEATDGSELNYNLANLNVDYANAATIHDLYNSTLNIRSRINEKVEEMNKVYKTVQDYQLVKDKEMFGGGSFNNIEYSLPPIMLTQGLKSIIMLMHNSNNRMHGLNKT